jgi:hypothetical protein
MIDHITTHVENALARLPEQYKNSPNLKTLISCVIEEIQEIEDLAFDFYKNGWVETGVGDILDMWGKILGEDRFGRIDANYRAALLTRIQMNRAGGQAGAIMRAIRNILNPKTILWTDLYPASFQLFVETDNTDIDLKALISSMKVAGVSFCLLKKPADNEKAFVFNETSSEAFDFQMQTGGIYNEEIVGLKVYTDVGVSFNLSVIGDSFLEDESGLGFGELYIYQATLNLVDLDQNNQKLYFSLDVGGGAILQLDTSDKIETFDIIEGGELIEVIN